MAGELVGQPRGRDEDVARRPMKLRQHPPQPRRRNAGPRRDIVGKARVERGGERHAALAAPAARQPAERPLGRDMHRLGAEGGDHRPDALGRGQREADLGIGRARHRDEAVGRDRLDDMPPRLEVGDRRRQRPHDAVDLRRPRIGNEGQAHKRRWVTSGPHQARSLSRGSRRGASIGPAAPAAPLAATTQPAARVDGSTPEP